MKKAFCDICGKEISGNMAHYSLSICSGFSKVQMNIAYEYLCKECTDIIYDDVINLKYQKTT